MAARTSSPYHVIEYAAEVLFVREDLKHLDQDPKGTRKCKYLPLPDAVKRLLRIRLRNKNER